MNMITAVIFGSSGQVSDMLIISHNEFGIIIDGLFEGKKAKDVAREQYQIYCYKINPDLDDKQADDMEILDDFDFYEYRNKFAQIMSCPRTIGIG